MDFGEQIAVPRPWKYSRVIVAKAPGRTSAAILSLAISDLLAAVCTIFAVRLAAGSEALVPWLLASFIGYWFSLLLFGLYPGRGLFGPERVRLRTILALSAFLPGAAVCSLWVSDWETAVLQFSLTPIGVICFGCLFEAFAIALLVRSGAWNADAIVLGDDTTFRHVRMDLLLFPELGLRPIERHAVETETESARLRTSIEGAPACEYLADIGAPLPAFYSLRRVPYNSGGNGPAARKIKRAMDLCGGAMLLILASPILLVAGTLIFFADGRPIFFRQARGGQGGAMIRIWKLRSMYRNAPDRLENILAADPAKRAEWNQHFKLRDDPRILPLVGNLIRRTSIDELPQLWNVLMGEMSLVGPRPFPENHLNALPPEFCELRHRMLPGITGLWQVTLRSDGGLEMQQRLDTAYVRGWSIWLDFYILFRTPVVLLSSRGAR